MNETETRAELIDPALTAVRFTYTTNGRDLYHVGMTSGREGAVSGCPTTIATS